MMKSRAERRAEQVLEQAKSDIPVDVTSIAQFLNVTVRSRVLEDSVSGVLLIKGSQAIMGVNALHHPHRQRFTIAHEIGHLLLHRDTASVFVDSSPVFFRDAASSEGTRIQEIEANAFASALLMPQDAIREFVGNQPIDVHDEAAMKSLAGRFEVSVQALTIRLTRLGLTAG